MALNAYERGGLGPNGKDSKTVFEAALQISRTGNSWGLFGQGATVTYAFRETAPGQMPTDTAGFTQFSAAQIQAAERALAAWADVANIRFVRVTDGGDAYSDNAAILFGNYSSGEAGASAFAYYPGRVGNQSPASSQGDIWVNASLATNQDVAPGTAGLQILTHEIGHAIGLSHPAEYNAGSGVSPAYDTHAIYYEDSKQYSLMSYFGSTNTGGNPGTFGVAPQLDDIAAAQRIYGANHATRSGDTRYGFNSSGLSTDGVARPWYELTSSADKFYATIWDGGGEDTLDFSLYAQAQRIDLREGCFSDVGGDGGNLIIAMGVTIENAITGSGADRILGNSAHNRLSGGGGNDTLIGGVGNDSLEGGAGTDYAVYDAATGNCLVVATAGGFIVGDRRAGATEGNDALTNMEFITFTNRTVKLGDTFTSYAAQNILRQDVVLGAQSALVLDTSTKFQSGVLTAAQVSDSFIKLALGTTSVATLSYQFFTGKVPTELGLDYLVSPLGPNATNINSGYYQSFSVENRYINFAVNLGKVGEGKDGFAAAYGQLSLFEATKLAYDTIFGSGGTDDKVHQLLDAVLNLGGQTMTRAEYFNAYGGDGLQGLGTKAAMVGWLLAEAAKADLGAYARANYAFLSDLADGAAYGVDILAAYADPQFDYGLGL